MIAKRIGNIFVVLVVVTAAGCGTEQGPSESELAGALVEPKEVYFFGDSITAGFGIHGDNRIMGDDWLLLRSCNPPGDSVPDDRCSNNEPGPAGAGMSPGAYSAYPFQFRDLLNNARAKLGKTPVSIYNYAATGSTPAHWDPNKIEGDSSTFPSAYPANTSAWSLAKLPDNGNPLIVFTLGANPLLQRWLDVTIWGKAGTSGANIGCVDSKEHASQCLNTDIQNFKLKEHLKNIYLLALKKGNVIAQKYYLTCPWAFATNDPKGNILGPSRGRPCSQYLSEISKMLGNTVNKIIDEVVADSDVQKQANAYGHKIVAICPGGENKRGECDLFNNHGFGSSEPWVLSIDTGIHPNVGGHFQLARGVFKATCSEFGFFCEEQKHQILHWPLTIECPSRSYTYNIGRCVYVSIGNNTPYPLKLNYSDFDHGQWIIYPAAEILPGQSARMMASKTSDVYGTQGTVVYDLIAPPSVTAPSRTQTVFLDFEHVLDKDLYTSGIETGGGITPAQCGHIDSFEGGAFSESGDTMVVNLQVNLNPRERCLAYYEPLVSGRAKCGDGYCLAAASGVPNTLQSTTCDCGCLQTQYQACLNSNTIPTQKCRGETGAP